jgi:DNA polymerase-3 subunit delta
MANEINKLVSFKHLKPKTQNPKPITTSDVELLVKAKLNTNIFAMIDALGQKNAKKATKLMDDLLTSGESEGYLLSMISYQFRNLLAIKDLTKKGLNKFQITKQTRIHPYVVSKTIPQCKNFTIKGLENIYQKLLQTDINIKTGKLEPRLALDLLVVELCKS